MIRHTIAFAMLSAAAFAQPSGAPTQPPAGAPSVPPPAAAPGMPPAATAPGAAMPGASARFITAAQSTHWIASRMDDADVYNGRDEKIGDVEDLIATDAGQVEAVVISVGGFLGLGERYVAVPMSAVRVTRERDTTRVMLDMTREQLREAPEFRYPNR